MRVHLRGRTQDQAVQYAVPAGVTGAPLPEPGATAQMSVLGSRGCGGFVGPLLGSSGPAAAHDAECSVAVVPRPGREVYGGLDGPGPRVVAACPWP
ncbi:hypothetical protein [Streptomyces sp. NPDC051636]|uniref:hypothetical protein n=1 Tax=Streptomyces sp. NPDC051636 TaxID=3365663 RepID=UPI00378A1E91